MHRIISFTNYRYLISVATAMSTKRRDSSLHLYCQKKWPGYSMRIHRSATHQRGHGRAQGKVVGYILSEIKAQQSQKTTRFRVSWFRHTPPNYP